jgi:RNA polymerase subunit RPABC4/transcription elongation factor Spt4
MTSEPQQEYIITDKQLKRLHGMMDYAADNYLSPSGGYEIERACRSRPLTKAPDHRLNTQPKGCTCEDCQRFRKEDCPYPGSNITMDRCNSFLIDIEQHDAQVARAATLAENKRLLDAIKEYARRNGYWWRVREDEQRYHWEPAKFDEFLKFLRIPQEPPK